MTVSVPNRFEAFRRLHDSRSPLLLPNAWDFASAALLIEAGHRAIGTTSLGVAAAAGKPDAVAATRAETVALTRTLGGLPALVTVDIEGGFSDDPWEVADLAVELAAAGASGINLEDGRPDGGLQPLSLQVAKIRAIKQLAPELFLNARTDTYWLAGSVEDPLAETLRRGAAFAEAGADGFFVPGGMPLATVAEIAGRVGLPLNVLHRPGAFTPQLLTELGVARVSTGSLLYRLALGAVRRAAAELNPGLPGSDNGEPPTYTEVQRLLTDFAPVLVEPMGGPSPSLVDLGGWPAAPHDGHLAGVAATPELANGISAHRLSDAD